MSGRRTITSRATVSPNSMMDSISLRSSNSITSSSAAASTIPRSSCSETNGPCLRPRPGRITFVRPISPLEINCSGGKRTSAEVIGVLIVAARSGWSTAQVFGTGLGEDEEDDDVEDEGDDDPDVPNSRAARIDVRNACAVWQIVTVTSSALRKRSGWLASPASADERLPVSPRPWPAP